MNYKLRRTPFAPWVRLPPTATWLKAKPVYWSVVGGSALAEAEVEYQDKTSYSIDVAYPVVQNSWTSWRMPWWCPGRARLIC